MNAIAVFIGCGLGGLARWGLSRYAADHFASAFPLGTIAVNVVGSFLIGFFFALFKDSVAPLPVRLLLTTGFLGGFTTFSTFALETVLLVEKRQVGVAAANFVLQNVAGVLAVVAGIWVCSALIRAASGGSA